MTDVLVLPGQGVQRPGMGADLFDRYPRMVRQASEVLGHSVRRLCSGDPERPLHRTLHTQSAVYVVNALACRRWAEDRGRGPDLALGHSLGEYNALCAAGTFGFQEGLALVARRTAPMDTVRGGGMSAVLGLTVDEVRARLARPSLRRLDVAALNTEEQVVLTSHRPRPPIGVSRCRPSTPPTPPPATRCPPCGTALSHHRDRRPPTGR
ncbi:acyltransferase domain-containing protein [Streptomyces sp. NPDC005012]|uniref:acyltransferase domain-containing protein n=1 Tax=Streptomyces sp. NPDC005012 TaxID=3154558 RepID=UPI0033BB32DD